MCITFTTLVRTLAALVILAVTTVSADGQVVQEYVAGLRSPAKLLALPDGSLLVAEAGNGPNTGRISLIDRDRRRFTVVDGLPSALFLGRDASGPSGLLLIGDRLYVSIGGGDTTVTGAGQGSEIPNPSPASPLFSSVLLLELPSADIPLGFTLPFGAHATLAQARVCICGTPTACLSACHASPIFRTTSRSLGPMSRVTYGRRTCTDSWAATPAWPSSTRRAI